MSLVEKIKDIEKEISRTQINKATMSHLCSLRAKLARYRTELLQPPKGGSAAGEGFDVEKVGDARVALIGFPSVGKSTILSTFTTTKSETASYEFTTLTCIPGVIHHKDCRIQLLDLPGIIEGASEGKGRGRQVIGVARSADLVLIVVDAGSGKADRQKELLEFELERVGIRLNQTPPNVYFKRKATGGVSISSTCRLEKINEVAVQQILHEYKIHGAEVLFREDCTVDQFIDVVEGNRKYVRCLYIYHKIDMASMEEVKRASALPDSMVLSCRARLNLDLFLDKVWEYLGIVRVYTKPRGKKPDFDDPLVLTDGRHGVTVESACKQVLEDEDVIQIVKKKNADKGLNDPNNAKKGPENLSRNQIKKTKKPLKS